MARPQVVSFVGGEDGPWTVTANTSIIGSGLAAAPRLQIVESSPAPPKANTGWVLRGVTSNERYVERREQTALAARQRPLGRPEATRGALIPIRKSDTWWALAQDERRAVLEDRSHHVAIGLEYLPAVARRLHHGRDLGEEFDFLTWFEFAPADTDAFEDLVGRLRETEEWSYVEREVDIRLSR
ncbi:MAG: chlorite dismutase family protein [Acidimicrobiales bacterium]